MNIDLSKILTLIPALRFAAMFGYGDKARDQAERALTIPEKTIRDQCRGMSEADTDLAVQKLRDGADSMSDGLALIASKGAVRPD